MSQHPIRVVVTDDLRRSRLTVLFRLLLAIPHYVWLALWTVAAVVVAIASWFATVAQGQTPGTLHRFLARYVRYVMQLQAYLLLAANPYPLFAGDPGYPIDVEIDPPAPQHRGKTAARILLALPALALADALVGIGTGSGWGSGWGSHGGRSYRSTENGAAAAVAFLAWFSCLARGSMPRGFRDLQAYALRYGAQTWGYLLLLTDRYPDARPAQPPAAAPEPPHPVGLAVTDDLARGRLTVLFRILLALPHLVWIALWTVVVIPAAVVAWFATLAGGRLPAALHRFFSAYLRYQAHVGAFVYLVASPFPGFSGTPGYPVDLEVPPAPEPQPRATTAFRLPLVLPAWIAASALGGAALVAAVLGWFAALATGRMPRGLRDVGAWSIRYSGQGGSYLLLLTDRYPYSGPYEFAEPPAAEPGAYDAALA